MKKLIGIIVMLVLVSFVGFGQVSPVGIVRVADVSTTFDVGLPIGFKIYNVADTITYVVKKYCAGTYNITTALAASKIETDVSGGTVTNVTGDDPIQVYNGTTTPRIHAKTGIEQDSLVKMDSTASDGEFAVYHTSGLVGRTSAEVYTIIGVQTPYVQSFEKVTADSAGWDVRLTYTPLANTISVSYNGSTLPSSKWSVISTSKIMVALPSFQADKINVSYSY